MKILKPTLVIIGVVQLVLGIVLLVPGLFASTMGLEEPPDWVNWQFAMLGARFLGFAFGMFLASRDPRRHLAWIQAMIGIQAIDWVGTMAYLTTGAVTITQVTTAAFLPLVFIVILGRFALSPEAHDRLRLHHGGGETRPG
jgi:hypothetical protein